MGTATSTRWAMGIFCMLIGRQQLNIIHLTLRLHYIWMLWWGLAELGKETYSLALYVWLGCQSQPSKTLYITKGPETGACPDAACTQCLKELPGIYM